MNILSQKKEWVLAQERHFAFQLAKAVIELPKLNVWMILIPIIIVFQIYRHNRAVKGRKAFCQYYLRSRLWALDEAFRSAAAQRIPDRDAVIAKADDLRPSAYTSYRDWIETLSDHFVDLLNATGQSYAELVQNSYRTRSNYLLFLNQLNQKEAKLNAAIQSQSQASSVHIAETIARIEQHTTLLRREYAEQVFP